MLAGTDDVFFI